MLLDDKTALILIDIQQGFEDIKYWGGHRNNPDAEEKASRLLGHWRAHNWPIYIVKHNSITPTSPLRPGLPGNNLHHLIEPRSNEPVIEKEVNSAFIGTDLEKRLKDTQIKQVVIAGLTTDHCISTSVRMSANLGFKTILVEDACATFDKTASSGKKYSAEMIHESQIVSLEGEFAEVVKLSDLV